MNQSGARPGHGVETADPWLLNRCRHCGYSLRGLASGALCPECGQAAPPETLVIFGWGCDALETANNARGRSQWKFFILEGALLFIAVASALRLSSTGDRVTGWILVASCLMSIGMWIYKRYDLRRYGLEPTRAHISRRGAAQGDGVGDLKELNPWTDLGRFTLEPAAERGLYRLIIPASAEFPYRSPAVAIEFECDTATAKAFERLIGSWAASAQEADKSVARR